MADLSFMRCRAVLRKGSRCSKPVAIGFGRHRGLCPFHGNADRKNVRTIDDMLGGKQDNAGRPKA